MTPRDRDEQLLRDLEAARAPFWGAAVAVLLGLAAWVVLRVLG